VTKVPCKTGGKAISRRAILKTSVAAGGGLLIGFHLPASGLSDAFAAAAPEPVRINAYLRISPNNTITLLSPKSEMGQGVHTALALLVAEELEADFSRMRVEMAPSTPEFGNMSTGGSASVLTTFDALRKVGAETRDMLRRAAAARWKVPVAETRAAGSFVTHEGKQLRASYGQLAAGAARITPPKDVPLKNAKEWKLIGTSPRRLDTPAKVDGSAQYGIDVKVPGMLIGAIMHCPVSGGTLKDVDPRRAMVVKGVKQVVRLENAVVVLADGYWQAQKGLETLKPQWVPGPNGVHNDATIGIQLDRALNDARNGTSSGDVEDALRSAARVVEATYEVPYLAHATMEPMNATAWVHADTVEIWAPVQAQTANQRAVAAALGIAPEKVLIRTTYLGGGFGRRLLTDFTVEAALASKAAGKPVKLIWSREEDIRHGSFRPRAKASFRAGLDKTNKPIALKSALAENSAVGNFVRKGGRAQREDVSAAASVWMTGSAYNIPNTRFSHGDIELPLQVGPWRSVQYSQNGFFGESIIDEMAHAAGIDPLAFRKNNVTDPRHTAVLTKVGEMAGWGTRKLAAGRALGVAMVESSGTVVGQVVEVSVTGREVRMHGVWCAVDCGSAVHPSTVAYQMESGIIFGLSAALYGQVNVDRGSVVQMNFGGYEVVRLAQAPEIKVALVESGAPMGGAGEPGVPPIAPALTNAIFAACGERVRALPLVKAGFIPV
jgi:isoquinoline 1-oxidoreductase beta subunit